uniref:Uncharacterized protein n=1 Tax=Pipistrellus kuhlii TaxID=59472 RepID=A0A7J7VVA2_PIPKU|nr:hypothetical protein mPipKuh1_008295 [Pipistrellus kuhlii]
MFIGVCGTKTTFKHCETGIKVQRQDPGLLEGLSCRWTPSALHLPHQRWACTGLRASCFTSCTSFLLCTRSSSTSVQQRQHDLQQRSHLVMEMILLYLEISETPPSRWGGKKNLQHSIIAGSLVHSNTYSYFRVSELPNASKVQTGR